MTFKIEQSTLDSEFKGYYVVTWYGEANQILSQRYATETEVMLWWLMDQMQVLDASLDNINNTLGDISRNTF